MSIQENRWSFKKVFGIFLYVVVLGFALVLGTVGGWVKQSPTLTEVIKIKATKKQPEDVFKTADSLTILVMGVDHQISVNKWGAKVKTTEGARSDMLLVARIDFKNDSVGAVSIPRDTLCRMRGYSRKKINAYHAIGGPDLAASAVETLLPGVQIDRTVVLDFDAFIDIVDILGGVDIFVPKDMKWDDNWGDLHIDLKKGRQHLDGYDAMGFARFRHTDSDYERQKRQKDLMLALKQKMMANPVKANSVANKSLDLLGGAFTPEEMASLMLFMESLENDNIKMGQVPTVDVPGTYDLEIDQNSLRETLAEFNVVSGKYSYARYE